MVHRCNAGIARLGQLAQSKKHNAQLLLGKGVGGRHTVALEEPFENNHCSLQQLNCGGEGWSSLTEAKGASCSPDGILIGVVGVRMGTLVGEESC